MATYFITDIHLGRGDDTLTRERQLVQFLNHIQPNCERLMLLGDIFDFWFTYRYVVPKGFTRLIGKLGQMADDGVDIHYFTGNHDMWVFDYFQNEIGCTMHHDPTLMVLDGKRFMIGHGDGLGHLDRHYDFLKHIFSNHLCQRLFAFAHPLFGIGIANKWSASSRKKHTADTLRYLGDDHEGIVIWSKEQLTKAPFDYFVFGHRHVPLSRTITQQLPDGTTRSALYMNVGEWIDHRNYAVWDGQQLTLHDLLTEGGI